MAADVHAGDAGEAERVECIGDGLALRIEQAPTRDDMYGDTVAAHSGDSRGEGAGGGDERSGGGPSEALGALDSSEPPASESSTPFASFSAPPRPVRSPRRRRRLRLRAGAPSGRL